EVEGKLADIDLDRGDAVERRRFIDPARMHDIEEEDGARSTRRRIVRERERNIRAAQFELIVVAPAHACCVIGAVELARERAAVMDGDRPQARWQGELEARVIETGSGAAAGCQRACSVFRYRPRSTGRR